MTGFRPAGFTTGSMALAAGAILAFLPGLAVSQVQVLIQGGEVVARPANPDPASLGDPWWDEALPAGKPAVAAAEQAAADPKGRARQQAQARLAGVRRNRGMQMLKRELSLIRASCPTLERAARTRLVEAGLAVVESQAAGRTPLVNGLEPELGRVLGELAGSAAAAAYREQLEARTTRKQEAAIAVLVEAIDAEAELAADQRDAVTAALWREWRPEWEAVAATALRQRVTRNRLPDGVVDVVAAAVDEETLAAWQERIGERVP
jgi:hypothetical protein